MISPLGKITQETVATAIDIRGMSKVYVHRVNLTIIMTAVPIYPMIFRYCQTLPCPSPPLSKYYQSLAGYQ